MTLNCSVLFFFRAGPGDVSEGAGVWFCLSVCFLLCVLFLCLLLFMFCLRGVLMMDKMLIYSHAGTISLLADEICEEINEDDDLSFFVSAGIVRMLNNIILRADEIANEVYFNGD